MSRILRKPEIMVLLAWSIIITVFVLGEGAGTGLNVPYGALAYLISLVVVLASIATALALGLKNILLAVLLALPGGYFMFSALVALVVHGKFINNRPIEASMLLFLFMATGGPLLIRSFKDEDVRRKIYQGALLLMVLLVAVFLFFA